MNIKRHRDTADRARMQFGPGGGVRSYLRFLLMLAGVAVAVALIAEWLLQPASNVEREHYLKVFAIPVGVAALVEPLLARLVAERTSIAGSALVVGVGSLALGVAASVLASSEMVINSDDLRVFIVVLLLASGLAAVLGVSLSRPFVDDIRRMGIVADRVASGDLDVHTGVHRADELGRTAAAIDEMVNSLQEAEAERERIAQARQMLFRSIGHDLRTPLSAMQAAVESLQDGFETDPQAVFALLESELRNVAGLVEQLTVYARIEAGSAVEVTEPVSITDVAHEAVEAFGPVARRSQVELRFDASGANRVTANNLDVARSIRNLIGNAVEHAGPGGWVEVRVAETTLDPAAAVAGDSNRAPASGPSSGPAATGRNGSTNVSSSVSNGSNDISSNSSNGSNGSNGSFSGTLADPSRTGDVGWRGPVRGVQVSVIDSGPGFPEGFKSRAFEPFTRADEARTQRTGGHAGLGLAITKGLVSKHHGHVWINDGPGGDVRMWIPAEAAPAAQRGY